MKYLVTNSKDNTSYRVHAESLSSARAWVDKTLPKSISWAINPESNSGDEIRFINGELRLVRAEEVKS